MHPPPLPGRLGGAFIDILFPPRCLLCRTGGDSRSICTPCSGSFRIIIPPYCTLCGTPFLTKGDDIHLCGECIRNRPPWASAASSFYYEGKLATAIQLLKYGGKTALAGPLGRLLSSHPLAKKSIDLIIPVPLHISRLRERGFNQSQLLATKLGSAITCRADPYLLERIKPTLPQVGMNARERVLNVKGAFALRKGAAVLQKKILLIDDVFTTGATIRECSMVLKKGGADTVTALTLARSV